MTETQKKKIGLQLEALQQEVDGLILKEARNGDAANIYALQIIQERLDDVKELFRKKLLDTANNSEPQERTCHDCIHLEKTKAFRRIGQKKDCVFYKCNIKRRLITMQYNGKQAKDCKHYQEQTQ